MVDLLKKKIQNKIATIIGGEGGLLVVDLGGVCVVAEGKKEKLRRRGLTARSYINYY
jgi:hypothetical protein